eukprot:TRINITY_DN34173_c0_g1_i3.p2 TRINITY_DN34173_c0_g1~~TRINITY_DN34173_c0_g1_i3.p2  ORF type:complete len:247 (-),score=64.07 TRINITY_DN34173_c0_g1_i3:583-1323(-)
MFGIQATTESGTRQAAPQAANRSRTPRPQRGQGSAASATRAAEDGEAAATLDSQEVNQLLIATARLSLASAQGLRVVTANTMDTLIIQKETDIVTTLLETTQKYAAKAKSKEKSQKANLGPPHLLVWEALVDHAKHKYSTDEQLMTLINQHTEEVKKAREQGHLFDYLADLVKYCRVQKTYNEEAKKLQVCVAPATTAASIWKATRTHILATKAYQAEMKVGPAPRSNLERRVQNMIDNAAGAMRD